MDVPNALVANDRDWLQSAPLCFSRLSHRKVHLRLPRSQCFVQLCVAVFAPQGSESTGRVSLAMSASNFVRLPPPGAPGF